MAKCNKKGNVTKLGISRLNELQWVQITISTISLSQYHSNITQPLKNLFKLTQSLENQ